MKYKESEVLDILKKFTDEPKKLLKQWNIDKSNTEPKEDIRQFVYSFPIIVNDEEVATITLVSLYSSGLNTSDVMQKYFGHEEYIKTWETFSHDTYLNCYLTIHKKFELPKIAEGFHAQTLKAKDTRGNEFEFHVSYGDPDDEDDSHLWHEWVGSRCYRFDNGVNIQVEAPAIGWPLGDKIKENIKIRLREQKIDKVIENGG